MPRGSPISLSFNSFYGATRRLVLINGIAFFVCLLLNWFVPQRVAHLLLPLALQPAALLHGQLWRLVTYSFINLGLLNSLFALMSLWFSGNLLESAFSSRWLTELYFASIIGGGILASALSFLPLPHLNPYFFATGAWSGVFGLFTALAVFFGEQEVLFMFVLRMKIKYMVALYLLLDAAFLLSGGQVLDFLTQLCAALSAWLFLRIAPRRGLAFGLSESYYGLRNSYYRWKRRRAAKKFTVYMRSQNRDVNFDANGRYVDPDETQNPTDKKWMN